MSLRPLANKLSFYPIPIHCSIFALGRVAEWDRQNMHKYWFSVALLNMFWATVIKRLWSILIHACSLTSLQEEPESGPMKLRAQVESRSKCGKALGEWTIHYNEISNTKSGTIVIKKENVDFFFLPVWVDKLFSF